MCYVRECWRAYDEIGVRGERGSVQYIAVYTEIALMGRRRRRRIYRFASVASRVSVPGDVVEGYWRRERGKERLRGSIL